MWFRQVEGGFWRQSIAKARWFDCVMTELPRPIVTSSCSLTQATDYGADDGYNCLKEHILKRFGKTPWQKGFALLHSLHLGNCHPSQLLQDLRALMPDGEDEKTIFQCLFLERLPSSISCPPVPPTLTKWRSLPI